MISNGHIKQSRKGDSMAKARVGNIIEFKEGLRGVVEKVYENSVLVELVHDEQKNTSFPFQKTVVNHKNYKIVRI